MGCPWTRTKPPDSPFPPDSPEFRKFRKERPREELSEPRPRSLSYERIRIRPLDSPEFKERPREELSIERPRSSEERPRLSSSLSIRSESRPRSLSSIRPRSSWIPRELSSYEPRLPPSKEILSSYEPRRIRIRPRSLSSYEPRISISEEEIPPIPPSEEIRRPSKEILSSEYEPRRIRIRPRSLSSYYPPRISISEEEIPPIPPSEIRRPQLEMRVLKEFDERGSSTRKLFPMLHSPGSQYGIPEVQLGEKRLYSVDGSVEKVFKWQEMGIFIHVPAGVVSPGYLCEITVSSVLAGKFLFPEEFILVSGMFAISTSCDILKPIRIHLQHCVNFSHDMEKDLTFAKADHIGRSPPYHFEVCDGGIFTSELQYQSLYGALECQKFSFIGILASTIRFKFTVRCKAQLLLNSKQWKAHVTVTKDIRCLLQNICGSFEDCGNVTDVTFSFAGNEVTVETEKESEDHQWEIKPLQNPCKIQRGDVNAYGPGSERSIPKLNFKLKPKPGCKEELHHEMKIKGATEPSLSLYLSCSPSSIGTPNITALADETSTPLSATSITGTPIATEQPQEASVTSLGNKDKGNTIVTAEIHQTLVPPPEASSREEPHKILKRQVSQLSRAISNPDRLATDMWSNELISDEFKDMLSTRDLSRLDKNDKLLTEMHRHLENSSSGQQLLGTFCSVLKGQGDPTLNQIADEMSD